MVYPIQNFQKVEVQDKIDKKFKERNFFVQILGYTGNLRLFFGHF